MKLVARVILSGLSIVLLLFVAISIDRQVRREKPEISQVVEVQSAPVISENPVQTVENFLEALKKDDFDSAEACLTSDATGLGMYQYKATGMTGLRHAPITRNVLRYFAEDLRKAPYKITRQGRDSNSPSTRYIVEVITHFFWTSLGKQEIDTNVFYLVKESARWKIYDVD